MQEDEDNNMTLEELNENRKRQEVVVGEDLEEVVGEDFNDVTMDEMRERKKRQEAKRTAEKGKEQQKKEAKKMKRRDTDTDSESEIEEAKVIKLNKNDFSTNFPLTFI